MQSATGAICMKSLQDTVRKGSAAREDQVLQQGQISEQSRETLPGQSGLVIFLRDSIITDLGNLRQSSVGELGIHLMGQSVINDEPADILETVLLSENPMSSPDLRSQTIDGFEPDLESVVKSG